MITASEIKKLQTAEPFAPFIIRTSDGRELEVKHPEMMVVFRNSIVVAEPTMERDQVPEQGERISILHVTALKGENV